MRPKQFTDAQLFETARRCFIEHGPNTTIATIASELGVSAAALFKRVGTKEELLCRALSYDLQPHWIDAVSAGPDDRPVREQLAALGSMLDTFFRAMVPRISVLKAAGLDHGQMFVGDDDPPPLRGIRALTGWFARLHERGLAHVPEPEATALAFLGALQARHAMQHLLGMAYPDGGPNYTKILSETFWAGIAPKESPS